MAEQKMSAIAVSSKFLGCIDCVVGQCLQVCVHRCRPESSEETLELVEGDGH